MGMMWLCGLHSTQDPWWLPPECRQPHPSVDGCPDKHTAESPLGATSRGVGMSIATECCGRIQVVSVWGKRIK